MSYQTYHVVLKIPADWNLLGFIFFSTICSYSFHWYLTSHSEIPSDRIAWVNRNRWVHGMLFFVGLVGALAGFLILIRHWFWLSASAMVTFLYSAPKIPHPLFRALRRVAIGKTIFLAIVWMYVTAILPVIVAESPWHEDTILFAISRFFLVYAICILFDYRDREDDRVAGIRSMVTWFGDKGIGRLFFLSLVIFLASTLAMAWYGYTAWQIGLLVVPGILVGLLYNTARRFFDDLFFYLLLDGLMMLSGLLMILTGN